MSGKTLELALRIKADLGAAAKEVDAFVAGVGQVETKANAAAGGLDRAAAAANKLGQKRGAAVAADVKQVASSADAAAAGLDRAAQAAQRLALQDQLSNGLARQKDITAEVVRRAQIEAEANARNIAAARTLAEENFRIASKRADSIAAYSAATPEQLRTPQDRSAAIGNDQVLRRDAELRVLEINRRADALEARLTATRNGLTAATTRNTVANRANAISAGQQQQAMRQLPAQITDVTTSLASGMPVWLVAIQQGGQIKDSFGGIAPAFRAVLGAVTPMAVGVTAGVAAIAAMAVTAYQGYEQVKLLERSLISSGNAAGATAGQLGQVRNEVAAATGAYGDAQAAVSALAASGKVSAAALGDATSAAVNLAELTGRSIEDTTDQIIRLAKAPTATLAELNGQYNFLTLSVYEHVRSLEAQGNQTAAAEAAIEAFARVHEQRVEQARATAGTLERKWIDVKASILGAIQSARDFGREDVEFRLAKQTEATNRATRDFLIARDNGGDPLGAARALMLTQKERLDVLIRESQAAEKLAAANAEVDRVRRAGVQAAAAIDARVNEGLDNRGKRQAKINALEREYNALRAAAPNDRRLTDGSYEAQVKAINDQFKDPKTPKAPKPKKTEGDRADDAAQRELLNLKEQITLLGSLEDGEKRATDAARIRFAISDGAFKNASPALKQQLQENAQLLDTERQKIDAAKALADVRARTLQLQGRGDEVQLEKTRVQLEALRAKLVQVGDAAGAAEVGKLMQLEQASTQLQAAERAFAVFTGRLSNDEQRVNIARQNGLISTVEAQRALIALRQEEIAQIQLLIPQLKAAALEMDGFAKEDTLARIDQLRTKLFDLQTQGTLLQTTLGNSLQTGIEGALNSLIDGTATAKEAVLGLVRSVASSLARLAVQQLASIATAKLMSTLFKKNESSDVGAGAEKLSSAAKELGAAAALLLVANSLSSIGFADGGFTGPGGKYQPAGIVHKNEYVQPSERMREPGALAFMRDFHVNGMRAIGQWRGYFDGGFVTPAAPSLLPAPRYTFADGGLVGGGGAPQLNMRLVNLIDRDALVGDYLDDPGSDRVFVNKIGRNAAAIAQLIGGGS